MTEPLSLDVWVEHEHILDIQRGRPLGDAAASFLTTYGPVLRRAAYLQHQGLGTSAADFMRGHEDAWIAALSAAAYPMALAKDCWPRDLRRRLIISFHFPRWPEIAVALLSRDVVALTPTMLPWLPAKLCDRSLSFREQPVAAVRALRDCFRSGKSVGIMGDYVYPGTRAVPVVLLGQEASMPLGLLRWAEDYGYDVDVVEADEDGVRLTRVAPEGNAVAAELEAQIRKNPANWLQWCSADRLMPGLLAGATEERNF